MQVFHDEAKIIPKVQYFIVQGYSKGRIVKIAVRPFCFYTRKDLYMNGNVMVEHFSTHSMRKTFGRKVYESSGENANMALMKLSELFNHSNVGITKIYWGIQEQELLETCDLWDF